VYASEFVPEIVSVSCSPGSRSLQLVLGYCTGHLRIGAEEVVNGEISWAATHPGCRLKPICIEFGGVEETGGVRPALIGQCLEEGVQNRRGSLVYAVVLSPDG